MPFISVGSTMRTPRTRRLALPLLALVVAVLPAITLAPGGVAEASGEPDSPAGFGVTALLAGPATFADDVSANFKVRYDRGRALNSNLPRDASNTITVEVTWEPSGTSGWHSHPGPVIVNVTEGQVTVTNAKTVSRAPTARARRSSTRGRATSTSRPTRAAPTKL